MSPSLMAIAQYVPADLHLNFTVTPHDVSLTVRCKRCGVCWNWPYAELGERMPPDTTQKLRDHAGAHLGAKEK